MPTLKRSRITWTDLSGGDLNFVVRGRTPGDCECSPGCGNCYALAGMERWNHGPATTTFYPEKLERLLKAKVAPGENRRGPGSRPLAFACDTGDICHPNVTDEQIHRAFSVMAARQDIDWQVLTKRPLRLKAIFRDTAFPDHVWLGTTVESQEQIGRIVGLLEIRAAVRFLSVEPMLGPMDLGAVPHMRFVSGEPVPYRNVILPKGHPTHYRPARLRSGIDWVIVGAESGPKRRPFDPAWARTIHDQCKAAGVACFLKQDSGMMPGRPLLLDGREIKEWPK